MEGQEEEAIRTGPLQQVLPGRFRILHVGGNPRTNGWIPQSFSPLVVAAFLYPGRHARIQPGGTGGIQIHVGRDAHARFA